MNLKYYIKNIRFGLYCTSLYLFFIIKENGNLYFLSSDHLTQAIIISTILCPFSKYAIEYFFFKFMKKDFFATKNNLNNAPIAKLNLIMLYDFLYLVLAIPFGLLGIIISIKNRD
ncbi:colicin transporter [Salmonella enterica subsp. enterica serovar Stanley]|uniref:Colicin transporter n=1 Tax=Salmonella enterica TaxID=28901 RepID=A0A742UFX7_SALER|nr:colicin transporter [Salmonella enterica subsp. enterica serovar Stanley]HAF1615710.1 colicin transporter [Salmonella enterica]